MAIEAQPEPEVPPQEGIIVDNASAVASAPSGGRLNRIGNLTTAGLFSLLAIWGGIVELSKNSTSRDNGRFVVRSGDYAIQDNGRFVVRSGDYAIADIGDLNPGGPRHSITIPCPDMENEERVLEYLTTRADAQVANGNPTLANATLEVSQNVQEILNVCKEN